ncbi:hypothetical protein [Microbacterium sp. ZW T5_56]|uniref:hypothetical protein n=1 Tax=Microbacterium sp. ZW T5_56 TaxID=3378081 RepID=UPI003853DF80
MWKKLKMRASAALLGERGDVPGWVLITMMTAALVMVIWAFAGDALINLVDNALKGVVFTP